MPEREPERFIFPSFITMGETRDAIRLIAVTRAREHCELVAALRALRLHNAVDGALASEVDCVRFDRQVLDVAAAFSAAAAQVTDVLATQFLESAFDEEKNFVRTGSPRALFAVRVASVPKLELSVAVATTAARRNKAAFAHSEGFAVPVFVGCAETRLPFVHSLFQRCEWDVFPVHS